MALLALVPASRTMEVNLKIPKDNSQEAVKVVNCGYEVAPEEGDDSDSTRNNTAQTVVKRVDVDVSVSTDLNPKDVKSKIEPEAPAVTVRGRNQYIGMVLALMSAVGYSLVAVIIKLLPQFHPITQNLWRQLVSLGITVLIVLIFSFSRFKRQPIFDGLITLEPDWSMPNVHWTPLLKIMGIGLPFSVAMICRVTALDYLPIADATVLTNFSIIFVLVLAHFVLHEKCKVVQSFMVVFIIVGGFIISRPPFLTGAKEINTIFMIGVGMKLLDGFGTAVHSICVRLLRNFHFAAIILIVNIVGTVVSIVVVFALQWFVLPTEPRKILLLVASGALTSLAHNSMVLALKFEKSGTVSLIRSVDVPLVFVWQIFILGSLPDTWTISGSGIVCTGVVVTSFAKLVGELPKDSTTRKRFSFLLK